MSICILIYGVLTRKASGGSSLRHAPATFALSTTFALCCDDRMRVEATLVTEGNCCVLAHDSTQGRHSINTDALGLLSSKLSKHGLGPLLLPGLGVAIRMKQRSQAEVIKCQTINCSTFL